MPEPDYYQVLGITRDATQEQIKQVYRQLALQYHPDRNKTSDAEERFKEISIAYSVLSDPVSRMEYNVNPSSIDLDEIIEQASKAAEGILNIIMAFAADIEKYKVQPQKKYRKHPLKNYPRNKPGQ